MVTSPRGTTDKPGGQQKQQTHSADQVTTASLEQHKEEADLTDWYQEVIQEEEKYKSTATSGGEQPQEKQQQSEAIEGQSKGKSKNNKSQKHSKTIPVIEETDTKKQFRTS